MKKFLKLIFRLNVVLLFISGGSFIYFSCTSTINYFGNIKTKDYFEKKIVKVESYEILSGIDIGGGWPKFTLNEKSYGIITTEKLSIGSYYYIWFNTQTQRAYLTTRDSKQFDVYKLPTGMKLLVINFGLAVLTFFTTRYFRRLYIKRYGLEELLK